MNLYLDDFESLFVILGGFVRSDQLDVVAVAWVAHNVVLRRENSFSQRKFDKDGNKVRCIIPHEYKQQQWQSSIIAQLNILCKPLLNHPHAGPRIVLGMKRKRRSCDGAEMSDRNLYKAILAPTCTHYSMLTRSKMHMAPIDLPSQLAYIRPGQPGTVGSIQLFQDPGIMYMGYF